MCAIAFQFQAYGIYFYGMWEGVGGREEEVGGKKKWPTTKFLADLNGRR